MSAHAIRIYEGLGETVAAWYRDEIDFLTMGSRCIALWDEAETLNVVDEVAALWRADNPAAA